MAILVREAGPPDAASIVRLIREMAAQEDEQSRINAEYVDEYLSSPVSRILLAEVRGHPAGILSYSLRPDLYHAAASCLIEALIVQEDLRDQGVGSALLKELFFRLEASRCAEVALAVMPHNVRAIHFYRRHGLTEEAVLLEKHYQG